ncbi:Dynein alpha chain, flagellar outer arm, partial [Termitomyces sp. J132]
IAFSQNYIFDPTRPSFALLPSDNAPPMITGHASVILPGGRLLVFGGYSQASGGLLQFSTIWTLDSPQSSSFWSMARVSNLSLPSPRRAFAATTISNGRVLIHGGSDARLQTNFEDGWILDTSKDPMLWTQVEALSQLGALRDHLAVSSGDQVIFSFGYGNDKPSPIVMRIFNTNTGAFESIFTPPSYASPTKTTGPNSGDLGEGGTNGSNQDSSHKIIGIAVGSVLGLLSLVVIAVAIIYYIRRRHADGRRAFRALGETDNYHDDESEHLASSIPAAGFHQSRTFRSHHGWDFGIFDTVGLAATFGLGTRILRHVPKRKDMLADEDTRDFTLWHSNGDREGAVDRTWSLRSLIPSLKRSREPSLTGSMGNISWRENPNTFADDAALIMEGEASNGEALQLHETNVYDDHDDERGCVTNQPYFHPISQQLSTLRTIIPLSQDKHPLIPLIETLSHTTHNETSNFVSHATSHNGPFDTISSITSHTFDLPPKSLLPLSSAVGTSTFVKRSDSWWSRFAKTSFLDRRSSSASKSTFAFRDPNPLPRLDAIQESMRIGSVDGQPSDSSDETRPSNRVPPHVSMLQGGHNKSQSSVRTADTEAIEKMARTMDVAHLVRSDSRHTASTSTTDLSIETRPRTCLHEGRGVDTAHEQLFTSMSYVDSFSHQGHHQPTDSTSSSDVPVVYPSTSCPNYEATVAARFERRELLSKNQIPLHSKQRESVTGQPVNYGLIPRATLFVANPDNGQFSSDHGAS